MDDADHALLEASHTGGGRVTVAVLACSYTCCARGWHRRSGYEQLYHGKVTTLTSEGFVLTSAGLGTVSYLVAVAFDELQAVAPG